MNIIRKTTEEYEMDYIYEVSSDIEQDYNDVYQILYDVKNMDELKYYIRGGKISYWDKYLIHKQLLTLIKNKDIIKEIYIYFPEYHDITSTSSGLYIERYHAQYYDDIFEEWIEKLNTVTNTYLFYTENRKNDPHVLASSIVRGNTLKAQIVVRLNQEYILNEGKALCMYSDSNAFVMIGNTLVASTLETEHEAMLEQKLMNIIEQDDHLLKWEGKSYEIVCIERGKDLRIIKASERGLESVAVKLLVTEASLLVLSGIIIMIFIAYMATSKNYEPIQKWFELIREEKNDYGEINYETVELRIRRLLEQHTRMQKKVDQYEEEVKNLFLCKLIFTGEMQETLASKFNIEELDNKYYAIVLYNFESDEDIENNNMSIWKETLSEYLNNFIPEYQLYCFFEREKEIYYVIIGDITKREVFFSTITTKHERIVELISEKEGFYIDFTIKGIYKELSELHNGYLEFEEKRKKDVFPDEKVVSNCTLERVLEIIDNNFLDVNFSVESLTKELNVSHSYLSRFFKRKMGCNVLDYIQRKRVEYAKQLFKENKQIKSQTVAEMAGFYNVSTFIRVFKKIEGMTPTQFKEGN